LNATWDDEGKCHDWESTAQTMSVGPDAVPTTPDACRMHYRALHAALADDLARLDARFLAERAALACLPTAAERAASVRLFYDGTPDKVVARRMR
jgi:hypothetical protein